MTITGRARSAEVYKISYCHTGNLRQLRQSLHLIRDKWADEKTHFRLWEPCPGTASPHLSTEEFALCFLLRRHEKRYRKNEGVKNNNKR